MAGFARISSAHRSDPGPEAVRELGSFIQEQMAAVSRTCPAARRTRA
ncbi:hypothetical protein [Streptomyces sp. NBC_00582]|nr:hypothetical protein [Streptomyces sp. NBC_00582]WUB68454.1 hypothetical protein OG852_50020 [Streptomyces sp. NBC_00582]